jgi:hypothetical protein
VRKNIKIKNPLSGSGWTSARNAKRYAARGLAEWVVFGVSVRFLRADDHRRGAVLHSVDATCCGYDRAAGSGMATMEQLANLPMVAPAVLMGFGRRKGATHGLFGAST